MGFIRRFFEKRATLRNPPDWLYKAFTGGSPTLSGQTVSPDTALTLSSYYAAIRAISEDVGKLPLILYRRLEPRGKERAAGHPLYRLLHDSPNVEMSTMSFRETLTLHAIGWGNGLAEIVRDGAGNPVALWPLDPSKVRIDRGPDKRLRYRIWVGNAEVTLQSRDVFHLHGLGFDGVTGYSVAHLARECIGEALAAGKSGAAFFGNNSTPSGVLEAPNPISAEAFKNLAKSWKEKFQGAEKSHQVVVLEQGIKFTPIGIPNKDAQWIEAREFHVSELARWLRIPPHKIGHLRNSTFNNIESQSIEYVVDCLQSWLVRWEQEISRKLLPERSDLFAEHLVDGLLRGDTAGRFNAYRTAILAGWMSRNEARALENLNPVDGLDEFLTPLNTEAAPKTDTDNPRVA